VGLGNRRGEVFEKRPIKEEKKRTKKRREGKRKDGKRDSS